MKTMTVLPTHLYKRLIRQSPDYDEHLRDQKDEILSTNLPPEIKTRLYQDVVRTIANRKLEEEARPLLVSTSQHPQMLEKKIENQAESEVNQKAAEEGRKRKTKKTKNKMKGN